MTLPNRKEIRFSFYLFIISIMTQISLAHSNDDELQTISIDCWDVDLQLHFDKSDMKSLKLLIWYLKDFLKNPMAWYIWMDYIDIWWETIYWLWYQDKQRILQIWFNWADVWLNLTKIQLKNIIRKLEICYANLLNQ